MHTTNDLIDEVKVKLSLSSDYATAKALDVRPQTITNYRKKRDFLGEKTALKVAYILEYPAGYVLACAAAERTKDQNVKTAWELFAKKAGTTVMGVAWMSASLLTLLPDVSRAGELCILCKILAALTFRRFFNVSRPLPVTSYNFTWS